MFKACFSCITIAAIVTSCSSKQSSNDEAVTINAYSFAQLPLIGLRDSNAVYEGGFSGLHYIPGTEYEFFMVNDRGPNVDASTITGEAAKVLPFPTYGPSIFHVALKGGQLQIISSFRPVVGNSELSSKTPELPGMSAVETMLSSNRDSVLLPSTYGVDIEGIAVDSEGFIWLCEEYRPALIRIDPLTHQVVKTYSFTPGWEGVNHSPLDSILQYRVPNRGFEGITITPNGRIVAVLQSPLHKDGDTYGDLNRILVLNPHTDEQIWYFYPMETDTGAIRQKDWKLGAIASVNEHHFYVLEHASNGGDNLKLITEINLKNATAYPANGEAPEWDAPSTIVPVEKRILLDLRAHGWDEALEKAEGIAVIDHNTIAIINDNDYGVGAPKKDGRIKATGDESFLWIIHFRDN